MSELDLSHFVAAIADFDDTIVDNFEHVPGRGLHKRSRLGALHVVGERHGIAPLAGVTAELNAVAFENASEHTVEGALWWLFQQLGLAPAGAPVDRNDPLVAELVAAKADVYRELLKTEAREVPGAHDFFGALHGRGFAGQQAIASMGAREDIDAFFGTHGFTEYFLPQHIISKEMVEHPKPHPESFQKALFALGLPPEAAPRVLAFEDDPRGITAAKSIGLFTCALTTRFSAEQLMAAPQPPDHIAPDFQAYRRAFGV